MPPLAVYKFRPPLQKRVSSSA
jgi:hypothetical protein